MIEKFSLDKANEAYGKGFEDYSFLCVPLTLWTLRHHAQW
jgi:hypothetical protein